MKNKIAQRMSSDKAAAGTTETIILIALSVFAALALFTGILRPIRENSDAMGQSLDGWFADIFDSAGKEGGAGNGADDFIFGGRGE